jgi:DNA-binding Xre family transcriptional regulator
MSVTAPSYRWHLRERLGAKGIWKTTELVPLLAERGVVLSGPQVYRLVAKVPERLSLKILAALCDILGCGPGDLIEVGVTGTPGPPPPRRGGKVVELSELPRPRRARVDPNRQP